MKELLSRAIDAIVQPETQASITTGAVITYIINPEHWVFMLTMVLLVGQVGLMLHKWYEIFKKRRAAKRGTKE